MGLRVFIVLIALVSLASLSSRPAQASEEKANKSYVRLSAAFFDTLRGLGSETKRKNFNEIQNGLREIVQRFPETQIAVRIMSEEPLVGGLTYYELDFLVRRASLVEGYFNRVLEDYFEGQHEESALTSASWEAIISDLPPLVDFFDPDTNPGLHIAVRTDMVSCYDYGFIDDQVLQAFTAIHSDNDLVSLRPAFMEQVGNMMKTVCSSELRVLLKFRP